MAHDLNGLNMEIMCFLYKQAEIKQDIEEVNYMRVSTEYLNMMTLRHQESMQKGVLRLLQSSSKRATRGMDIAMFSSAGLEMSRLSTSIKGSIFGNDDWIINNGYTYSLKNRRNGIQKQNTIEEVLEKSNCIQNENIAKAPKYASVEDVKRVCEQLRQSNHDKLSNAGNQIKFDNGFAGCHELGRMLEVEWVNDDFAFNCKVSDPEEDAFNRQMINRQIENILSDAGVCINEGENLTFSIDPYSYEISVNGNVAEEKRKQIEDALNQGENGWNLYTHVYFCAKDRMNSTQISQEGQLKRHMNDLFYEFYGIKLCECKKQGDDFITPDGRSVRDMIGTRNTTRNQGSGMYAVDTNGLKHHYLDLMQPYSYDTGDTQTLEIAYTSTGLHDLHQDYSLGNGDVDWIERKRTELEQELGREIYALF